MVKSDHARLVTGCNNARGSVYEVLADAERLAAAAELIGSPVKNPEVADTSS